MLPCKCPTGYVGGRHFNLLKVSFSSKAFPHFLVLFLTKKVFKTFDDDLHI